MDIQATKLEIIQYILNAKKESVIANIQSIIKAEDEEKIVGYTASGIPINEKTFNEKIAFAEADIKAGRTISSEDLAKEIETW